MKLLYGRGRVVISDNIGLMAVMINFRGNPYIFIDKNKGIILRRNSVVVSDNIEDKIFRYFGYMKILNCSGILSNGEEVPIKVQTMGLHLPELMAEYPDDISNFPERMRKNYIHRKKYRGKQYKPSRITGTTRTTTRTSRATTRTGGGY